VYMYVYVAIARKLMHRFENYLKMHN